MCRIARASQHNHSTINHKEGNMNIVKILLMTISLMAIAGYAQQPKEQEGA